LLAAAIEETAGEVDFGLHRSREAEVHLQPGIAPGDRLL
jgi:hypothetical protein